MQENNQSKQAHGHQLQTVKKRSWHKTWWGILLIIFVFIPLFFTIFIAVFAINSPHQKNYDEQNTPANQQAQREQQEEQDKKARQAVIDTYSQPYCDNHANVLMKNDPVLTKDNWPTFDGRRNWTLNEITGVTMKEPSFWTVLSFCTF